MTLRNEWLAAAVAGTVALVPTGMADDTAEEINALKQQIEALSLKVHTLEQKRNPGPEAPAQKVLERERERDGEAAAVHASAAPRVKLGADGLTARSGDANFAVGLHGVLQLDNRTFFNDGGVAGNDGFLLRRARPVLQGTVYRDFDFLFVPDFGGSTPQIFDAYVNYRYRPGLQLRVGKFKTPIGLEQLVADRDILFNERSLVTDLVPNRDLGVQLWGDLGAGTLSYAAGLFNGIGDARNSGNADLDADRDFAGRVFVQPFKQARTVALQGFGFGISGSYGSTTSATGLPGTTGGTLPGFATDGQQQFFAYNPAGANGTPVVAADGVHWRFSPQGYYYYGPFGLIGEYIISDQRVRRTVVAPQGSASLAHTAWQITASWLLTGETASNGTVTPLRPFDPSAGRWGALQLVGRVAQLEADRAAFPLFANPATSARAAGAWSAGLNWYLNKNLKLATSYSHTTFSGGGGPGSTVPATITRQPENVFFARVQLAF